MDTNNSLNKLLTTLKYDELELLENFLLIIFFNLNHHMQWTLSHFLFWLLWRNNCQDFSDNRNFAHYPARILVHCCFFHCWNGFVHYQRKDQICKPKSQDRKSEFTGLPNSNWQFDRTVSLIGNMVLLWLHVIENYTHGISSTEICFQNKFIVFNIKVCARKTVFEIREPFWNRRFEGMIISEGLILNDSVLPQRGILQKLKSFPTFILS